MQAAGGFAPVDPSAMYRVVTNDFVLGGGDGYTVFTQGLNKYDTGLNLTDALTDYIKASSPVTGSVDGRIAVAKRLVLPVFRRDT